MGRHCDELRKKTGDKSLLVDFHFTEQFRIVYDFFPNSFIKFR